MSQNSVTHLCYLNYIASHLTLFIVNKTMLFQLRITCCSPFELDPKPPDQVSKDAAECLLVSGWLMHGSIMGGASIAA